MFYNRKPQYKSFLIRLVILIIVMTISGAIRYRTTENTATTTATTETTETTINYAIHNNSSSEFNSNYPQGSAGDCSGKIAVVSIFASTPDYEWDFSDSDDIETRDNTLEYLGMATDWISQNAQSWNNKVEFIYDWENESNLYYEATLSENVLMESHNYGDNETYQYIESNISSISSIEHEYDADSVVYVIFFNTDDAFTDVSNTAVYYDGCEFPYEYVNIYCNNNNIEEPPAAYAHEILHTFGAPDLYMADEYGNNYGTTDQLVEYVKKHLNNEIMYTVYDKDTWECHYDMITNELTEITAYYIGWTDSSEVATKFDMAESSH